MTDQNVDTATASAVEPPKALTVEDARKLFEEIADARIAPLAKKYNGELADHRKGIDALRAKVGGGEMPKPADAPAEGQAPSAAPSGLTRDDLKAYAEIAKLRERLGDLADEVDSEDSEEPFADRLRALRVAEKVHSKVKGAAGTPDPKTEKPGRDARSNGSQRGHAPASRSAEGAPSTVAEWLKIPADRRNAMMLDGFDPRTLPHK